MNIFVISNSNKTDDEIIFVTCNSNKTDDEIIS